ncbi:MAG: 4-hydroxy-tetrahydrodipicolinate synthase [Gemmatimonadota bacterium]
MSRRPPLLAGCGTAMATPFTDDGRVDEVALRRFVDWQISEGIHFLVPCGSTGEAATLTIEEHVRVVAVTVDQVAGRVPVVAGAGSNDTARAVALSTAVRQAGATHLLHVSPMYNKPPQRGIIAHYTAIAESAGLPIVVYNVPGRTAGNIEAETALALAEIPGIVAIKEASGNLAQIEQILRHRPRHFSVLSGDDALALPIMALGGQGVISVTSNATPAQMARLVDLCQRSHFPSAAAQHAVLSAWMSAAFVESNPIPVKAALSMLGLMTDRLRLPLVPLADAHRERVRSALRQAGADVE